jgi:glyoxylase-like metal-dependent hydrolase (beta-lactamase superfamily II)
MEQVADGIHRLGSRAHNFYIIAEGDEATIVDLGCRREWKSLIGGLAALGLGPASVSAALATHAHGDHLDTDQAYESLERLEMIDADLLLPGHGRPFEGTPAQAVELARRYRQS